MASVGLLDNSSALSAGFIILLRVLPDRLIYYFGDLEYLLTLLIA